MDIQKELFPKEILVEKTNNNNQIIKKKYIKKNNLIEKNIINKELPILGRYDTLIPVVKVFFS